MVVWWWLVVRARPTGLSLSLSVLRKPPLCAVFSSYRPVVLFWWFLLWWQGQVLLGGVVVVVVVVVVVMMGGCVGPGSLTSEKWVVSLSRPARARL